MEITIKLHGNLKRFGNQFTVTGDKVKEGMSALLSQINGFRMAVQNGTFKVIMGDKELSQETIFPNFDSELEEDVTLQIIPVIKGAKGNMGIFNVIVGVVLIAASWWAGGAAGWGYLGAAGYAGATSAFMAGVAMIAAGVATMLTPTPKMGDMRAKEDKDKKASTSFSNTSNVVAQGRPVPLCYGEIMTGSLVVSKGVKTFTENVYKADKGKDPLWGLKRVLKMDK